MAAISNALPAQQLAAGFSSIWISDWAKMEAIQGSRNKQMADNLCFFGKWTDDGTFIVLSMRFSKTSTCYCRKVLLRLLLYSFFTHNQSFLREWRPFGTRRSKSFVSVAKWKIQSHLMVQSTHLNVSHVKMSENRNENWNNFTRLFYFVNKNYVNYSKTDKKYFYKFIWF